MSASPVLETLPDALLDTLVSHIITRYPSLVIVFLSALGTRVHASAVRVLFTSLTLPDDARYFLPPQAFDQATRHPISTILSNPDHYARTVKRIIITDTGVPADLVAAGSLGLMTIEEEDGEAQETRRPCGAFQPMPEESLNALLMTCMNLEEFVWSSSHPPPDGVCETLSEQNPRLVNFTFRPDAPLRPVSGTPPGGVQPVVTRPTIPKWDGPSLPLLAALPLTKLHVTRLSQQGSRALAVFFAQSGEYSLLEDVSLDFVWLDDQLCEKLVEAGRRIRRLKIGTSGTKLTDKGVISLFEGCDALEDFGLIEAQGRLSRNLWSKLSTLPAHMDRIKIAISESGPHHSWTADHLLSFGKLPLDALSHLSVVRIAQLPHFSKSGEIIQDDSQIDDVATLRSIPRDVVAGIRVATNLTVLECDWWAWRPEDVKALLERCTQLEHLKIAFDAPFAKLLTLTSAFTPLTQLLKLSVSVSPGHAPGLVTVPTSPTLKTSPTHPLTPAASPVRRRNSLPSPEAEPASQHLGLDDLKPNGPADPSLPPIRDVKRFVKKCPRLIELEWYGRNARGKWLISRSVTTSKINTNVSVDHHPPVVSPSIWEGVSRERVVAEFTQSGGFLTQNIERQGQGWTGTKAEQFFAERAAEREKEEVVVSPEKPGKTNGTGRRSSNALASISAGISTNVSKGQQNGSNHSPVQPFTPLSPPTSTKSFAAIQEHAPAASVKTTSRAASHPARSPRRTPSEPTLRTNGTSGSRARSATASGGSAHGGSGSSSRGRNGNSGGGSGRGRGSGKSGGGGSRRNSTGNGSSGGGGSGSTRGGSSGRGHGAARGGKRKPQPQPAD